MTAPRRLRRLLAIPAGIVLALTAAIAAPSAATAAARPQWTACTEEGLAGFDCATYKVPLDYDKPHGATTTIALARRPAGDRAHKIGTIFMNPGGPGGAGRGLVTVAHEIVAPDVLARFDIVGFDPRGVASSEPLQCFDSNEAEAAFLAGSPAFLEVSRGKSRDRVRQCTVPMASHGQRGWRRSRLRCGGPRTAAPRNSSSVAPIGPGC